jgi:Fe-S-cluster containining protein
MRSPTTPPGGNASVDCGSCSKCCRNAAIILLPQDADWYEKVPAGVDADGKPYFKLPNKPDGSCHYLSEEGRCTIHGRAPIICRQFSCVEAFNFYSRQERRQMVKDGVVDPEIWVEGRKRSKPR